MQLPLPRPALVALLALAACSKPDTPAPEVAVFAGVHPAIAHMRAIAASRDPHPCNASAGEVPLDLPEAGRLVFVGATRCVRKADASPNACRLVAHAGQHIDGLAEVALTKPGEWRCVVSIGTGWATTATGVLSDAP